MNMLVYGHKGRDVLDPLRAHGHRLVVYEGVMHTPFIGSNAWPKN